MKTLMMLLLAVLLGNTVKGQDRPIVVDNTKYFPPYQYQVNDDCSHLALVYYLKSSLWNREFDRDPKLKENQFSNSFVWDQNADVEMKLFSVQTATAFMENQGCATVADFPITSQGSATIPSLEVREKALAYKSKGLISKYPRWEDDILSHEDLYNRFIENLKDSLINGVGFCVNFAIFEPMEYLKFGDVYNYKSEYFGKNGRGRHVVAITGYNDTIQTANGRGAFKVINSWENLEVFYIDYAWFKEGGSIYSVDFLEENFSSQVAQVSLSIDLNNSLHNKNYYTNNNYRFVSGLVPDSRGGKIDFFDFMGIWHHKNVVQITKINGVELPYEQRVMLNLNSVKGDYKTFTDISDLCHPDSFESLEVLVYDPISVEFKDKNDKSIYSFSREAKASVPRASVHLVDCDSTVIARVETLSDTTIVLYDYYSRQMLPFSEVADWYEYSAYIKESSCLLARTLITFDRKNVWRNSAPVFTNVLDSVAVYKNHNFRFEFKATDVDGDSLSFLITKFQGSDINEIYELKVSINPVNGVFEFCSQEYVPNNEEKVYEFTVRVSDGHKFSDHSFKVLVQPNKPAYLANPLTSVEVFQDSLFEYRFQAIDDEGDDVKFKVYNFSSSSTISVDEISGLFRFISSDAGDSSAGKSHGVNIELWDGNSAVSFFFSVIVKTAVVVEPNSIPVITNTFDSAFVYVDSTFSFQFIASDADKNDVLKYKLLEGVGATLDKASGLFNYVPSSVQISYFTIEVSDGKDSARHSFEIRSDIYTSVAVISMKDYGFNIYPNPFADIITVNLSSLEYDASLKIEIFDLAGRLIAVPLNGKLYSSEGSFQYDSSNLKSGIYICRLSINAQAQKSIKIVKH